MGHLMQHPGELTRQVSSLCSELRAGKGCVVSVLAKIVGLWNYIQIQKKEDLTGKFNSAVVWKIPVSFNEQQLKSMTRTGRW